MAGGTDIAVTGVSAAGAPGSETVVEGGGVVVQPSGVQGAGAIGTVTAPGIVLGVTGVEATHTLNYPVIWEPIVPSQTPDWIEIGSRAA